LFERTQGRIVGLSSERVVCENVDFARVSSDLRFLSSL